ncbi:MAG: hypothetical protein ACI8W7_001944 [Gammaproteobacteria bacterium]|jgi:hypothetical protein
MSNRFNGPVRDRSAWRGSEFVDNDAWAHYLTQTELAELESALEQVIRADLPALEFSRESFVLPTLGPILAAMLEELENGRGFALLRGIPVELYDEASLYRLYWGIAVHLGNMISQNAKGDLIGRVENVGVDINAVNARGYMTNAALHPHNDSADIVGLLCVRQAKEGGQNMITSAMTIYNELLATHPEYLDVVYDGFHYDVRGEGVTGSDNEVTHHRVPIYSYFDERLSCRYNKRAIETAARKRAQPLSLIEQGALDTIEQLTLDPQMRLDFPLLPGDLQLLNNHMVLHARSHFIDWPQRERQRLLLRLWVNRREGEGRLLAPGFADRYNTGDRQGVAVSVA